MKEILAYHCCSDGRSVNCLFDSPHSFEAAVNRLAATAYSYKVKVLAYCLMGNHIHVVIEAKSDSVAMNFLKEYMRLNKAYYARRNQKVVGKVDLTVVPIKSEDQLRTAIAYVLRNPTFARLKFLPEDYPYSSASLYFKSVGKGKMSAVPLSALSKRNRYRILGTHIDLPDDWLIEGDKVLNESFVDYVFVESLFVTPRCYLSYIGKKVEPEIDNYIERITLSDQDIKVAAEKMADRANIRELDVRGRMNLARKLRGQYNASARQLSRVLGLPVEDLSRLL